MASIQTDLKALVAYSRVCHMRLPIVQLYLVSSGSSHAVVAIMIGHGVVSAILFTYVALVSEIKGRRSVLIHSGGIKAGVLFGPLCRLCLSLIHI